MYAVGHTVFISQWIPYQKDTKVLCRVHIGLITISFRGSANDWFEAAHPYLFYSTRIRRWFCEEVFLNHRERFCAYLLECPSTEVLMLSF